MHTNQTPDAMMKAVFPAFDGLGLALPERRAVSRDGARAKRALADATVLVTRRQQLNSPLVTNAARVLESAKAAPIGIVVTK